MTYPRPSESSEYPTAPSQSRPFSGEFATEKRNALRKGAHSDTGDRINFDQTRPGEVQRGGHEAGTLTMNTLILREVSHRPIGNGIEVFHAHGSRTL